MFEKFEDNNPVNKVESLSFNSSYNWDCEFEDEEVLGVIFKIMPNLEEIVVGNKMRYERIL